MSRGLRPLLFVWAIPRQEDHKGQPSADTVEVLALKASEDPSRATLQFWSGRLQEAATV